MTPYAIRAGYLPAAKVALFQRLVADFQAMPDLDPDHRVSCHAVCRALEARHAAARCVDGFFHAIGNEHSWLDLGDGVIADMYPIAASNPFMVDASHWMVPWHRLYIARPGMLEDGKRGTPLAEHEEVARMLTAALAEYDRRS